MVVLTLNTELNYVVSFGMDRICICTNCLTYRTHLLQLYFWKVYLLLSQKIFVNDQFSLKLPRRSLLSFPKCLPLRLYFLYFSYFSRNFHDWCTYLRLVYDWCIVSFLSLHSTQIFVLKTKKKGKFITFVLV